VPDIIPDEQAQQYQRVLDREAQGSTLSGGDGLEHIHLLTHGFVSVSSKAIKMTDAPQKHDEYGARTDKLGNVPTLKLPAAARANAELTASF